MHTESLRKFSARVFMILAFCISPNAWGQTDDRAKQVEAAKKEGKLIWYTSAT